MTLGDIAAWPGKSRSDDTGIEHPAAYHMLDVAAVAEVLVAPFGLTPELQDAVILLVALHDLGKINDDFRQMLRGAARQGWRHWEATELLLDRHDALLEARLGGRPRLRQMLYAASAGHHGRPPDTDLARTIRSMAAIGSEADATAGRLLSAFLSLWPRASLAALDRPAVRALSWWLPGLIAAADWIGSNTAWFPAHTPTLSLADYRAQSRIMARRAVIEAGFSHPQPTQTALFDFALRPMQEACNTIRLPEGPMLAVIEDETGAGKTEAALILAQRMLQAGKGRGLYFALPTMATSDAMFRRARQVVGRLFTTPPTLTLAHGRAGLSVDLQDILPGAPNAPEDLGCTDWLAESRRRALLADVGVGTIDQALLAALPTKFHTLRHFALSSKILIVDEVHELGEPYIGALLQRLLQMHRQAGGSAILLTATLPLAQRAALMEIYGSAPDSAAYPALSIAGGASRHDLPQATGAKGPVAVRRLDSAEAAVDLLVRSAEQGAACVWVRNAVDEAFAAVEALRLRGVEADLLHARFALADRKRIEAASLSRFGKHGEGRQGRVLVGTQVLESSLDLDFDVMVSDLAPVAALIQRAGRLWRHMDLRPAATRPVAAPVLHVVAPDPEAVTDERWLARVLGAGAAVYHLAEQWRTARVLFRSGEIVAPSGLRALIEAVHGPAAEPAPAVFEHVELRDEGQGRARAAHGWQNAVDLSLDFRASSRGDEDALYPTRLGEPTQVLALCDAAFRPIGGDWALAEVSVAVRRLRALALADQQRPEIAAIKATWPEWRRNAVTICPVDEGGRLCEGLSYASDLGLMFR